MVSVKLTHYIRSGWQFVDRPILNQIFLGEGHGLSAEGVQFSALLPLPFFSQIEWGYWTASGHGHDDGTAEGHHDAHAGIDYENGLLSTDYGIASQFQVSSLTWLQLLIGQCIR